MAPIKPFLLTPQRPMPPEDGRWLAAVVRAQPDMQVLDAGCGSGIAALSLLMRCPDARVTGLELHGATAMLARTNATLNHAALNVVEGDVLKHSFTGGYDAVMCNPPFHGPAAVPSAGAARRLAHHAPDGLLKLWFCHLAGLLKPNGVLYLMLHAAQRNEVAMLAQETRLTGFVHALASSPVRSPKRLLVRLTGGLGGVREGVEIAAYDPALREAVLRDFKALDLGPDL